LTTDGSGVLSWGQDLRTTANPVFAALAVTTINNLTITMPLLPTTLTIVSGKTFSCNNTLTLTGTDGSTLNVGAGGTLGSAAFTASSAYEVPLTFSTGLTRSTNTVTVNTSQNIATLSNLTSNGFVKTSGGTGALSIDTSTYLTANQTITLSGDISGSGSTAITTTIGASKVTNSMLAGSIAASKLVGTDIATVGTITAGTWNATLVGLTYGGTGQSTAYAGLDALTVKGADIASASTTNLATATGTYVNITGTTTITALGTANAGVERICQFSGALTLTHNATSLILPGAANITTSAGDVATFSSLGSGNWICTGFTHNVQPWNGQLVLLATGSASNSATIDLTWASGRTYQEMLIIMSNVTPATTTVTLQARTSADGTNWDSGASNYTWTNLDYSTGSFSGTDTKMIIAGTTTNLVTTANNSVSGEFKAFDPGASTFAKCGWELIATSGGQSRKQSGGGNRASAGVIRGVRFFMSSGNIASGEFRLYGIVRA
jgi:hypothetical protein